jgi:hypothetical protein
MSYHCCWPTYRVASKFVNPRAGERVRFSTAIQCYGAHGGRRVMVPKKRFMHGIQNPRLKQKIEFSTNCMPPASVSIRIGSKQRCTLPALELRCSCFTPRLSARTDTCRTKRQASDIERLTGARESLLTHSSRPSPILKWT